MHALPTTDAAQVTAEPWGRRLATLCERRTGWMVLLLVAVAGAFRIGILREFWLENPFALFPTLDSELYWQWAAAIADGHWAGNEPFQIAPLYPYLLGGLRWCGGGLLTLYCLQLGVHLATGAITAAATRNRFGGLAACVAAFLFFGLSEPALFATRILGTTLQLFLVAVLWWDSTKWAGGGRRGDFRALRLGVWVGLLALAFPAALLLIPTYAVWFATLRNNERAQPGGAGRFGRAGLFAATALLVVSPATLHNYRASGEFIPITGHAGITLASGNGPGSIGIFTPIHDLSGTVRDQARESALAFERATGRTGTWGEIDAFYRSHVLDWWRENPRGAGVLFLKKAWWFATSRHYDNVTAFSLEREYGLQDASVTLPIETPWIMGFAALGAALLLRRTRRAAPEVALVAVPLIACVVFMYSARYRVVAVPVLCGLAAYAVVSWRGLARPVPALLAAGGLPVLFLLLNSATGFGNVDFMRDGFADLLANSHIAAGRARRSASDVAAAEVQFERASEIERNGSVALLELAALKLDEGRFDEARWSALRALRRNRDDALAERMLYDAQVGSRDYRNAEVTLNLIEKRSPRNGDVQIAMAWFYAANPDAARRNPKRSLLHARAAERILGGDSVYAVMALALAKSAVGDFDSARTTAARGAELARSRSEATVAAEFDALAEHAARRHVIASPPPRLGRGAAVPLAAR